ncbi:L-serine dehydratase [Nesterenkonia xinjiangensis]|uniref:L-serine dehydratase n=4 Tax=Nesterenkonia xinjiangensis TaxID=225327 RepID=A0A7Z0GJN8_9MICC|nr:L-serine dehydratase [Nesterenkonia xinjiangensis]
MRAARRFVVEELPAQKDLGGLVEVRVDLYGSLAATGQGHGTFEAVLLGLEGWDAEAILPEEVDERIEDMRATGTVQVGAQVGVGSGVDVTLRVEDFVQRPLTFLPQHSNGMVLTAVDGAGAPLAEQTYFSIGGGFVLTVTEAEAASLGEVVESAEAEVPHPFTTAAELMEHCRSTGRAVSEVMMANETVMRPEEEVRAGVLHIWQVMEECKNSALGRAGVLPGGLNVRRRAPGWHARLTEQDPDRSYAYWQEWVNLVALAVNEENASGGRVVTAPTNGAAGIIPAVGFYATHYGPGGSFIAPEDREEAVVRYLLTAAAIGVLYKEQASISGAEVGCQGEVGSASSMAAAGLCEVLGGSAEQVENAAEIAMEHNLGLTCDPISGLVQVPCIERNAIAATKAVNAARMALMGDGQHRVSLDEVIVTMRETGADMSSKYKETAQGGLAVNVIEC